MKMPNFMDPILKFLVYAALIGFVLLLSCGGWILQSSFEARAFNAVTGKNVSTWQAMWIELRVQESAE